jgi:FtsH-binding integral membrane protein
MAHHETAKTAVDALSVVTVVGTLSQVLPAIAALFTIIWTGFRIYETQTVQRWLGKSQE